MVLSVKWCQEGRVGEKGCRRRGWYFSSGGRRKEGRKGKEGSGEGEKNGVFVIGKESHERDGTCL